MALKLFTNRIRAWRDSVRRAIAIMLLDRSPVASGEFEEAILFVRWDAKLGDTVVLSWVWRELKAHRPDLKLWVATGAEFYELFDQTYALDRVVLAPKRPSLWSIFGIAKRLKKPRYVVHLSQSLKARDMVLLRLIEPEHVAGLDDSLQCIDIKLGAQTAGRHFSEKLLPFLQELSVPTTHRRYWLPSNAAAQSEVLSDWRDGVVIGFCPFGASRHRSFSEKKIVMTIEAVLASAALRGLGVSVFLIVTADKETILADLLAAHDLSSKVFLRPTLSLTVFFEQVRACAGIISVDTSAVHVAAGMDKPLLAIYNPPDPTAMFGSTNYANWHPNSDQAITFIADTVHPTCIDAFDDDRFRLALDALIARVDFR